MTMNEIIRCINIDWLEVYCLEPLNEPRTPDYFEQHGYIVRVRSYGTPNYRQMYTIFDEGHAFIEVRREPVSLRRQGGIAEDGACHLRLANRACYLKNPVQMMADFILAHSFTYKSISRIDLALDFHKFDNGMLPKDFVKAFMRGDYQKLNQANIAAHGRDGWEDRCWNSLKWGAPTSAVTTKLYNKTMELKEVKDKPYIRECWNLCGLPEDEDIWRVEFSISPNSNVLLSDAKQAIIMRSLSTFDSKDRQFFQFCVFCSKYFHFKHREYTSSGALRPKGRCKDIELFHFSGKEKFFTPTHLVWEPDAGRIEKLLAKKLYELSLDATRPSEIRRAAEDVALHMADRYVVLDYVRQLQPMIEYTAATTPAIANANIDIATLNRIRDKYALSTCRPKTVRKKKGYLLIE